MDLLKKVKSFVLGDDITKYKKHLTERNIKGILILGLVCTLSSVFALITTSITKERNYPAIYICGIVFGIIALLAAKHYKKKDSIPVIFLYIACEPGLIMAMFMDTVYQPDQIAVSFLVSICLIFLLIIDKPYRVIVCVLANITAFLFLDYSVKPYELFMTDLSNCLAYGFIAICENLYALKEQSDYVSTLGKLSDYSKQVEIKSRIDQLTGILNRGYGEEIIRQHIDTHNYGMFCIIDGDRFKHINDTYGHAVGDKVLEIVAECLQSSFRHDDIIVRMGGDEFAVYAPGVRSNEEVNACLDRLQKLLEERKLPEMKGESIHLSIGHTLYLPGQNMTFEEIYTKADAKMYLNKSKAHKQDGLE